MAKFRKITVLMLLTSALAVAMPTSDIHYLGKGNILEVQAKKKHKYSKKQAEDKLWRYVKKKHLMIEGTTYGIMYCRKENGEYCFRFFEDHPTHIVTLNFYYINCKTGKLRKEFDWD